MSSLQRNMMFVKDLQRTCSSSAHRVFSQEAIDIAIQEFPILSRIAKPTEPESDWKDHIKFYTMCFGRMESLRDVLCFEN